MGSIILLNDKQYELMENVRDGFNLEDVKNKCTDYFDQYDYVVGDWAYGKLRLKGFNDANNKHVKELNNIKYLKDYLQKNCAFDCRYFVIKKCTKN